MPFPTAWQPLRHVDSARRNRSGGLSRADAQVRRALWSGEPPGRPVNLTFQRRVRSRNVSGISEGTVEAQSPKQKDGRDQR